MTADVDNDNGDNSGIAFRSADGGGGMEEGGKGEGWVRMVDNRASTGVSRNEDSEEVLIELNVGS